MSNINAGVVLVTKFVSADSAVFSGYIDYINRSNAIRNDNIDKYIIPTLDSEIKEYNEYMEYMGDAKKTTELFTNNKNRLSSDEKEKLKDIFQTAQNNDSLMWQTVISFDNKWLADNGLYDPESSVLNEVKIKEYARTAINTMLEKEGMDQNSIWSAAIHYNTDNIHIHVATVQPIPNRETKTIKTIRFNNKWLSENIDNDLLNSLKTGETINAHKTQDKSYSAVLDEIKNQIMIETGTHCKLGNYMQLNTDGTLDVSYFGENNAIPYMAELLSEKQVQKGVFKESSIEAAKSKMVNKIISQNLINDKINSLMRDTLIDDFKNISIEDQNLQKLYASIYNNLPANKRLWQYNNNIMTPLRSKIDQFTTEWLKQNHRSDYDKLQEYLSEQHQMYQTAYGGDNNNFADNKIKDLYSRCGNIVLKSLKDLAKSDLIDLDEIESSSLSEIEDSDISIDDTPELPEPDLSNIENTYSEEAENQLSEEEVSDYLSCFEKSTYLNFSEKYKRAKRALYGTKKIAPDHQLAFELLEDEAQSGNAYAIHDLANCYAKGLGCTANSTISYALYQKALQAFEKEAYNISNEINPPRKQNVSLSYLKYRIGKMYYYGQGTEVDKKKAFEYFSQSDDNAYSLFYLAKFYENGENGVVLKDLQKSFECYSDVCKKKEMPHAYYKKAYMLEKGLGTLADSKSSQQNYKAALDGFLDSLETRPDDFLQYRIGQMYLNGKGCDVDLEKGIEYLELSYKAGNDMAACTLADIYIKNNDSPETIKKAFEILHKSADDNHNVQAQYNLGKLYMDNNEIEKALKYFETAAEQGSQFAQYKLGVYYMDHDLTDEGIKYLNDAAQQSNQFAQYKLGSYYLKNKDIEKGINYLKAAVDQNNSFAQYRLGAYYLDNGDTEKGIELLIAAVEQENLFAQYKLGVYYLKNDNIDKGISYLENIINTESEEKEISALRVSSQYRLGSYYLDNGKTDKGIELLTAAVEQGNLFAQYKLGSYYLKVGDINKGISYLENIINTDLQDEYTKALIPLAQYKLGAYYLDNGDIVKGLELLSSAAEQNNQFAQYKLGSYYFNEGNIPKGIDFLLASAKQGNQFAQCKLGIYYLENDNIENGISYLQAAAKQNNVSAKFKLSSYYLNTGDIQKGIDYLLQLSDEDNIFANIKLGNFYAQADYFDFKKAEKYYLKAVGKGVVAAEYNLGILYLSDQNNIRHCLKGMDYLNIAAEQGNQFAMYQLGKIYFYGNKYISPNKDLAVQYLTGAAAQGHTGAQYLLKRPNRHKLSLPKIHVPYELTLSLYKLTNALARDYRTHENIVNQIAYAKLQQKIEEERS